MSDSTKPDEQYREVRFEHSAQFVSLLGQLGVSLLVSTYQAGKLVVVGTQGRALSLTFHNFDRPMGLAVDRERIALGARNQIWTIHNAPEIAPKIEPAGQHDACFLARSSHVTGDVHVHEMAWSGAELWFVNTMFSCLCTLQPTHSFVPRWQPPFITELVAEDRCHLNGMTLVDGQPKYATALAESDAPGGWRPNKATSGCVIDVPSGATIVRGLCMPHSPRWHDGRLWLLNSGLGSLVHLNVATGASATVTELPGYTRGLAFHGQFAFVGLSKIRETTTFGGVPIAERRDQLKCGVAVVDLASRSAVAYLEFKSGVDEIFDVQILPSMRFPAFFGPFPAEDGSQTIWLVPKPQQALGINPKNQRA